MNQVCVKPWIKIIRFTLQKQTNHVAINIEIFSIFQKQQNYLNIIDFNHPKSKKAQL